MPPKQKTALVIEDHDLNRKLFRHLLEGKGFKVVETDKGEDSVNLVTLHQPDLIVVDVQLPGISGLEVTKTLKKTNQDIPILIVTALAMRGDEEKILASGCNAYLPKPVTINQFLATVDQLLPEATD